MKEYLNREYGEEYCCNNNSNTQQQKINADVNLNNDKDDEEITHIRYEPVTKTKLVETFSITTQVNGETKETPLIRIECLEWLFG